MEYAAVYGIMPGVSICHWFCTGTLFQPAVFLRQTGAGHPAGTMDDTGYGYGVNVQAVVCHRHRGHQFYFKKSASDR